MDTISIISLVAGSITVLLSIYGAYKYIKKKVNNIVVRIEDIELSLKTKQRFIIPKNIKVIIEESNKLITLEKEETIVVDKIEGGYIFGKIYHNTVNVKVSINDIGKEI